MILQVQGVAYVHPDKEGQSEKPVAILALVFSTMHTIWIV